MILVTHDPDEARALGECVVPIGQGRRVGRANAPVEEWGTVPPLARKWDTSHFFCF